jgi:hypothetical protein
MAAPLGSSTFPVKLRGSAEAAGQAPDRIRKMREAGRMRLNEMGTSFATQLQLYLEAEQKTTLHLQVICNSVAAAGRARV